MARHSFYRVSCARPKGKSVVPADSCLLRFHQYAGNYSFLRFARTKNIRTASGAVYVLPAVEPEGISSSWDSRKCEAQSLFVAFRRTSIAFPTFFILSTRWSTRRFYFIFTLYRLRFPSTRSCDCGALRFWQTHAFKDSAARSAFAGLSFRVCSAT